MLRRVQSLKAMQHQLAVYFGKLLWSDYLSVVATCPNVLLFRISDRHVLFGIRIALIQNVGMLMEVILQSTYCFSPVQLKVYSKKIWSLVLIAH